MHIGLIIDEDRLRHERVVLNLLCHGLVDLGDQVTRIVPEQPAHADLGPLEHEVSMVTGRLEVPMPVPPWLHRLRARRVAAALDRATPEVLYAVGDDAWSVGIDLARGMGLPVVLEIWRAGQVRNLPRGRAAEAVSGYIAHSAPLAEAARRHVDPALVTTLRPGVTLPAEAHTVLEDPAAAISLAIIGGGRDIASYLAMLAGLSRIRRELPQLQSVIELRGPREHDIWREARRLDLLGCLTAITDAAPLRTLLTCCDLLVMPERFGEIRSLTLDAMASGMGIIAARDPVLDMLVENETATIVHDTDPEAWSRQLRQLVNDVERTRGLGAAARAHVEAHHRAREQVARLHELLERAVGGDNYSFADARGADSTPSSTGGRDS